MSEKDAQLHAATQRREIELWKQWDQTGRRPEALAPLLTSLEPLVQSYANKYQVRDIPPQAVAAEFRNQAVKAVKTYNPNQGAQLGTWVHASLQKGSRFVHDHQNTGRIVESRLGKITELKNAKMDLADQLGRAPTDHEVSRHMRVSTGEVQRLNLELRNDVLSSRMEGDPYEWMPKMDNEIFAHLEEELSPEERKVFQHIQKPKVTGGRTGNIATSLGWSAPKVSRLRKSIEAKAKAYQDRFARTEYKGWGQ